ncbi:MAG: hypothetical protein NTV54_08955 [Ignavibacteriales bacterium]|nr:hypothetical protein [Ignavibacteriales bacterium]
MTSTTYQKALVPLLALLLVAALTWGGCKKDNNPAAAAAEITATDDAAESVAGAVGINNGGALDQVGDVLDITTGAGLAKASPGMSEISYYGTPATVQKQYDSTTGWWTLTLSRQRGIVNGVPYAEINRVYKYQFLSKFGAFLKNWRSVDRTGAVDTAYSVHHIIQSGTGTFQTRRLSHTLSSLHAEWMVTGAYTSTITINTINGGAYTRVASNVVTTLNAVRTLNDSLSMTFIGVTGPRGDRLNLSSKTGGTITGTYHATVSVTRGIVYSERTIDRSFTITLGGSRGRIAIGGRNYDVDLDLGEVL